MIFLLRSLVAFSIAAFTASPAPSPTTSAAPPIVILDEGEFTGTSTDGLNSFLGIPFAQPPVGDLRFRLPQALGPYSGIHDATAYGISCPQQVTALPSDIIGGEDCLFLNVITPAHATNGSKLPVVVWIYGGGFEVGSSILNDGGVIVNRSIVLNEPVVLVSMNYRVSAFGFIASREVKDAGVGNIGLHDQRVALHWVQKYIHAFGGDPSKVTIWGQSSGAMSVAFHMLAYGGKTEDLFRAAFMESGSPLPVGDITLGQKYYDDLVKNTGCSGSSDTLTCLREAPYERLKAAVDMSPSFTSYQSLALAWVPRVDGVFLEDNPQKLVQEGKVARIPSVSGNCDDEGTYFSLSQLNVTTDTQLRDYLTEFFLINVTDSDVDELLTLYPQDVTQGSPYDTGTKNAITPQFKRIASILGDLVFQAPRRFFLDHLSEKQNTWFFLSKRLKSTFIRGSYHASDLLNIFGPGELTDYLIHFVANLDPNDVSNPGWPLYTTSSRKVLTFIDGQAPNITTTKDTYRAEGMELISNISLAHPQF